MTKEKVRDRYTDDVRLALLEQSINNINNTLLRFEKRFDQIDLRFDNLNSELKSVLKDFRVDLNDIQAENKSDINDLRNDIKADFRWFISIFGGLLLSLGGMMAHGFHWF
jgi:hypothetical protein